MLLLILVGALLRYRGKITDAGRECLTDVVIEAIIPCSIVLSFVGQGSLDKLLGSLPIIGLSILSMAAQVALGKICFRHMEPEVKKLANYAMVNSNCMFIGFPVILSLLGEEGAMLQSLYMIFTRSFIWSYGLSILTGKGSNHKETVMRTLKHPCMIAALVGIILMLTEAELPDIISRTMGYFSSCLMAMSMLLIGSVLYGMDVKSIFRKDVWWYNLIRLVAAPAAALGICLLFRVDYLMTGVVVIMAGMPSASMTAVLAPRYHCDVGYGSLVVATSTVASIVTIPLWYMAVRMIFGM